MFDGGYWNDGQTIGQLWAEGQDEPAIVPGSVKVVLRRLKIPLNLPLQRETFNTPLLKKGDQGGFLEKHELEFK